MTRERHEFTIATLEDRYTRILTTDEAVEEINCVSKNDATISSGVSLPQSTVREQLGAVVEKSPCPVSLFALGTFFQNRAQRFIIDCLFYRPIVYLRMHVLPLFVRILIHLNLNPIGLGPRRPCEHRSPARRRSFPALRRQCESGCHGFRQPRADSAPACRSRSADIGSPG